MNQNPKKSSRRLGELFKGFPLINLIGTLDRSIIAVSFDSRKTVPGGLFVAIPGLRHDGSRFIKDAIDRGASAIVTSVPLDQLNGLGLGIKDVSVLRVEDCRKALARVAAEFYGHPSRQLGLVGITGTNGKTTLTYMLEAIFTAHRESTGIIGSIDYHFAGERISAAMTTPESPDINRMLREMVQKGIGHCFLEVSSHALALHRVDGLKFSAAVFTNFSRDHLDFHGTMENYKRAKKKLFTGYSIGRRVVNIDDPVGRELMRECSPAPVTTGLDAPADFRAEDCGVNENGCEFTLATPMGRCRVRSPLLGRHNIYNMLSAAAAAVVLGVPLDHVAEGLRRLERIPGRFERVRRGQDFSVVVDYAHTGDALKNALSAARSFARNRVIVVFGCGGDRDRGKRKEMGRIALELSDLAVITSDNPRTEDPEQILRDICEGLPASAAADTDYICITGRREGIRYAIGRARPGDLVLIAGKGHEDYQILQDETIHFDDREVAAEALDERMRRD